MKTEFMYTQPMMIGKMNFDFSRRTYIMGVLNVTPDSFSDGGSYATVDAAVSRAMEMIAQGADIIDIGGESTRPKTLYGETARVTVDEELHRVIPVIERIAHSSDAVISIDTTKSAVAEAALHAGAVIINDISGLSFDPEIADVAARNHAALIAMHIQGTPETMQENPSYLNVVAEVKELLKRSVAAARTAGVKDIIIDPGIGFGKNVQHNLTLIKHLAEFQEIGCPLLVGTSRKGFIGSVLNVPVDDRLEGTAASVTIAIMNGANIIRVHDVKEMKRIAVMVDAIKHAE
jgi:dihydropteroate synthase